MAPSVINSTSVATQVNYDHVWVWILGSGCQVIGSAFGTWDSQAGLAIFAMVQQVTCGVLRHVCCLQGGLAHSMCLVLVQVVAHLP